MNSLIKATHKKWIEKIKSGEKTYELSKGFQNIEVPCKIYIYEPKNGGGCGMVVGEFICDEKIKIDKIDSLGMWQNGNTISEKYEEYIMQNSCLGYNEIMKYSNAKPIYALNITAPKFYDKPKKLSEFKRTCKEYDSYNPNCVECKYFIDGRGYEFDESDCSCNGFKPITHAPQNFIYCEDLEEK